MVKKCCNCENAISKDEDSLCSKCGLYWRVESTALRVKPRDEADWGCTPYEPNDSNKKPQVYVDDSPLPGNVNGHEIESIMRTLVRQEFDSVKKEFDSI